ncbi:hypothetical protein M011DRAFT_481733 [Sporormia fimetaria CBS 119925]|uniref:DUF7918 domain-containing protein n=1 Tax=Sporormia fimetaria CBS 119925 TaxID=1340428 RepID=A0A6A6UVZ6_9PLEO|nr:hypothetical protein M011DRAFT_481733 [Sporormia fimetaria CBS 119925]
MAVLDALPGLKVEVLVDGAPLEEFDDIANLGSDFPTISKFVKAVSGSEFAVKCSTDEEIKAPRGPPTIRLDSKVRLVEGVRQKKNGRHWLRKFRFSELETMEEGDDDDVEAGIRQRLATMGTIRVDVSFLCFAEADSKESTLSTQDWDIDVLPYKTVKKAGLSHSTNLGEHEEIAKITYTKVKRRGDTVGRFVFKYRSEDTLERLRVLPRPPSPVPVEAMSASSLSTDETRDALLRAQEKIRRLLVTNEKLLELKREAAAGGNKRKRTIESAASANGVVTGDDDDVVFLRDLGTICVSVVSILTEGHEPPRTTGKASRSKDMGVGPVSEKALKGKSLSHSVTLATHKEAPARRRIGKVPKIVKYGDVRGCYVFKYRSEAALKALWLLPRSPSPDGRELSDPSPQTLEQELGHAQEENGEHRQVKSETAGTAGTAGTTDTSPVTIKRGRDDTAMSSDDEVIFVKARRVR